MFILSTDFQSDSIEEFNQRWNDYRIYLQSIKSQLSDLTYQFAIADWHYDATDHRCPHDSWVEHVHIVEHSIGERNEIRWIEIQVKLLGAYHDGHLEITYKKVKKYQLFCQTEGHDDWRYDEVRISDNGYVIHEVEFFEATWLIECEDIEVIWHSIEPSEESRFQ